MYCGLIRNDIVYALMENVFSDSFIYHKHFQLEK